ncbi:MAG: gliding motility-associated C-terminal domain-containing protein [Paludibacteraceae bacterium]|nr:gliding motility-associated C-terminal domain-containing protein [Paludibacteraceae bacterium]
MRRNLITILLTLVIAMTYASDIECVGIATQVVKGNDTTFIFRDEIHLRSNIGDVDWYRADGSLYASGTDEIYPDEGCYRVNNTHFCVQLYQGIDDLDFTIEPTCENTILHVTGSIGARVHTYSLSYNALAWNTEEWVDSAATMSGELKATLIMPPLYGSTPVRLCYDAEVRNALGMDSACVEVLLEPDSVKAVKMELTSLATARGEEGERSNERNRPTSQTLIQGSEYSGPLEVAFYSNPTPGAQFYLWKIYKSTELLVTRNDRDIRYVFSEPGAYRVVCAVNNQYCTSDSMEVSVQISESYLAVPNVFTPNGDGKNDEFRVAYRSLREFHCWVYNRWGKLVYEWTDPAKGWDGTINGRPAAEGAYYYVIRALGTDAAKNAGFSSKISYTKKKLKADESVIGIYQMSGDINLLRGKR